jgi:murein DD-endopeptidase MepM/ murein hydrolase activator NlpD
MRSLIRGLVTIVLFATVPCSVTSAAEGPVRASAVRAVSARELGAGGPRYGDYWQPQAFRIEGALTGDLYRSLAAATPDLVLNRHERTIMAWAIADVLRWEADFTRDIRPGDHFAIVFERLVSSEGEVRYGRLIAAQFRIGGRDLSAYEFDASDGRTAFYDADGISLQRSFLRMPVEFRRISSDFSRARFHPILRQWRAHEGIDYAAASGSPVQSVGDGVVLRVGWVGGYGRLVEVRHPNGVVSRYGHLRGFAPGIRVGVRVSQGQCLGFVGASGLATGPHLHFEFRVGGVATDPRTFIDYEDRPQVLTDPAAFRERVARLMVVLGASAPADLAEGQS